jgi:hypothetical protein
MRLKGIAATAVASGCLVLALPALSAQPARHHHGRSSPHVQAAPSQPTHIACTVLGCMPVPAECGQTYGRTLRGIPTGYDVIVCPPGVWPLK